MSDKRILLTCLLCFFFGGVGAHRFYVGKIWTGILQLITLGGLGVWVLIDLVRIMSGSFTDKEGNEITQWTDEGIVYAGFWRRYIAYSIDSVIIAIFTFLITIVYLIFAIGIISIAFNSGMLFVTLIKVMSSNWLNYSIFVLIWIYYTLMESSSKQATLGKMAVRIVVTDLEGKRISFARANARSFGKIISAVILLIGYIMVAFTGKKQALHDILSKCLVSDKDRLGGLEVKVEKEEKDVDEEEVVFEQKPPIHIAQRKGPDKRKPESPIQKKGVVKYFAGERRKKLLLVGLSACAAIIVAYFYLSQGPKEVGHGDKIQFKEGVLYYTTAVTPAEAAKLGRYLVGKDFFNGASRSIQLNKTGNIYEYKMNITKGTGIKPVPMAVSKQITRDLSQHVFNRARVNVHYTDDKFKTMRVIKQAKLVKDAGGDRKKAVDGADVSAGAGPKSKSQELSDKQKNTGPDKAPKDAVLANYRRLEEAYRTGNGKLWLELKSREVLSEMDALMKEKVGKNFQARKHYSFQVPTVIVYKKSAAVFGKVLEGEEGPMFHAIRFVLEDGKWKISHEQSSNVPIEKYSFLPPEDGAFIRKEYPWSEISYAKRKSDTLEPENLTKDWDMQAAVDESFLYVLLTNEGELPAVGIQVKDESSSDVPQMPYIDIEITNEKNKERAQKRQFRVSVSDVLTTSATFDEKGQAKENIHTLNYSLSLTDTDNNIVFTSHADSFNNLLQIDGKFVDIDIPRGCLDLQEGDSLVLLLHTSESYEPNFLAYKPEMVFDEERSADALGAHGELVLYLSMDGSIEDTGKHKFPVKSFGDEIRFGDGVRNGSVFIGGSEDWIEVAIDKRLKFPKGATLELWFKRDDWVNPYVSGSGVQSIAHFDSIGVDLSNRKNRKFVARAYLKGTKERLKLNTQQLIPPDVWTHFAVVYDMESSLLAFYVSGKEFKRTNDGPLALSEKYVNPFKIGTWHKSNQAFRGWVDEVKLYDYARSPEQIAESVALAPSETKATLSQTEDEKKMTIGKDDVYVKPEKEEVELAKIEEKKEVLKEEHVEDVKVIEEEVVAGAEESEDEVVVVEGDAITDTIVIPKEEAVYIEGVKDAYGGSTAVGPEKEGPEAETSDSQLSHIERVLNDYPGHLETVNSRMFGEYVDNLFSQQYTDAGRILESGQTAEVIKLLSDYKKQEIHQKEHISMITDIIGNWTGVGRHQRAISIMQDWIKKVEDNAVVKDLKVKKTNIQPGVIGENAFLVYYIIVRGTSETEYLYLVDTFNNSSKAISITPEIRKYYGLH